MADHIYECDLHLHTTASDGGWSPEEVVALTAGRGVEAIAVTDHDTTASVERAVEAGRELGVEVISGVELTTAEGNHMLGYFIRPGQGELAEYLSALRLRSLDYMRQVVGEMRSTLGLQLSADELESRTGGGIPNMSHLLDLLHHTGRLPSPRFDSPEAIEFFGDSDYLVSYYRKFAGTKPFTDTAGAIRMIRETGGAAVWAHPLHNRPADSGYVGSLKALGLTGLEVVTPKHDSAARAALLSLCHQYNLVPTGGTDYHGRYFESIEQGREIGSCGVDRGVVDRLRKSAEALRPTG
jgi:3',5'-nucleoside bisphosphate phosphatase